MKDDEPRAGRGDEAAHHAAYLDFYRRQLVDGVLDLSEEQRRETRLPSGWTPLELLSHVLHMERRWFLWRFLGEDLADPAGDWLDGRIGETRWAVAEGVRAEDLADRLLAVGERTSALLREHDLAERAAAPRGVAEPVDLRWTCFHVLQEYARHAGHLDVVRELAADAGR